MQPLPEEVLFSIYSYLLPKLSDDNSACCSQDGYQVSRTLASICRASKQFRRLANPLLYNTIQLYGTTDNYMHPPTVSGKSTQHKYAAANNLTDERARKTRQGILSGSSRVRVHLRPIPRPSEDSPRPRSERSAALYRSARGATTFRENCRRYLARHQPWSWKKWNWHCSWNR